MATDINWDPLPDVSREAFKSLLERSEGGDAGLDRAIRRLRQSLRDPNGVMSSFSSFVE